jgi:hypothetical protein
MRNTKRSRRTLALLLAIAIGPALAGSAVAWFEGATNTASYLANVGAGCIQLYNHVTHTDGSSPMSVVPHLIPKGTQRADASFCKAIPGTWSYIAGTATTVLVKLTTDHPVQDTYSVCQVGIASSNTWMTELTNTYSWTTAPCGAGFYAAVTCTTHISTFVTDWAFYITGEYPSPAQLRNCHHARRWHPVNGTNENLTVNL